MNPLLNTVPYSAHVEAVLAVAIIVIWAVGLVRIAGK